MADRKQFVGDMSTDPELRRLLDSTAGITVTEKDLKEQRISFAFGNAPANMKDITKKSVKLTSQNIRLKR